MTNDKLKQVHASAACLKKAAELAKHVIKNVAGNEVANTINNSEVSGQTIEMLVLARVQKQLKIATV